MSNEMWKLGKLNFRKIDCASHDSKGVYCLQYDDEKIVSGLRDNTIKVLACSVSAIRNNTV